MTAAAAEWFDFELLKPWRGNPRKNDKAVQPIARSIQRFGFGAPIVARLADREIIAGHTRHKAMAWIVAQPHQVDGSGYVLAGPHFVARDCPGPHMVPVRFLDVSVADAHLLALADNKDAEIAKWDDEQLGRELAALQEQSVDLILGTGFREAEVDRLIKEVGGRGRGDGDGEGSVRLSRADELQAKWGTQLGQVWSVPSASAKGEHRLLVGDACDLAAVERMMRGGRAAWMWTDPPYGVSYAGKTEDRLTIKNDGAAGVRKLLREAFAVADGQLEDGAPIYVAHPARPGARDFMTAFAEQDGWHLHETLIWLKDSMVLGHSDYHYKHEPILYGWKGKNRPWHGGRDQTTVLEHARPKQSEEHPTMKPVPLVEQCVGNSSVRDSIGYDPFAGSGTTLVAAERTGRLCRAVELDPKFAAVVLERLAELGLAPRNALE